MELVVPIGVAIAAVVIAALFARRLAALQAEIAQRQEQIAAARAENAALTQDNKWLAEEIARQQRADLRMRETFQALAADALKENRASFLDLAKTSFERY